MYFHTVFAFRYGKCSLALNSSSMYQQFKLHSGNSFPWCIWLSNNFKTCSDAHFPRSLVTDQLKSPKIECSNPPQDLGPSKIQFWWSHVPLFLWCCRQACYYFPTKFKPQFSSKDRHFDQCTRTADAPCFG